ncbi:type II toxin-antitoxin system RelE/ParE family toxin [Duganella sp. 1411]|uniref:type II toxin-antitoxin system RelE/ParE family toxin n=1 Tax=Duganella sp. 1411 TaxID=2806572 RepID=UPI001AE9BA1D
MAEYRLTPAAERDLESIWIYTSQRWSIDQADRYIDMLTATRTAPRPPCRRCA